MLLLFFMIFFIVHILNSKQFFIIIITVLNMSMIGNNNLVRLKTKKEKKLPHTYKSYSDMHNNIPTQL